MAKRIGEHFRGNVVAYVALFFALGGSAYGITALDKNSVKSKHIKNGQVKSPDVRNNGLTGRDVNEITLGKVPSTGSADTADTAGSADTADTAGTLDNSLGDVMWAVVKSDVSIARSSPGVSVTGCLNGCVRVFFPRSVTDCAWVASPSSPDTTDPSGGFVTGRIDPLNNSALRFHNVNPAGTGTFLNFHVIVTCPPA